MDNSKNDFNRLEWVARIVFLLAYQGSLLLVLMNQDLYLREGNPIMRMILDHTEVGAIILFLIIAAGMIWLPISKNWVRWVLIITALVLLVNFIREAILIIGR